MIKSAPSNLSHQTSRRRATAFGRVLEVVQVEIGRGLPRLLTTFLGRVVCMERAEPDCVPAPRPSAGTEERRSSLHLIAKPQHAARSKGCWCTCMIINARLPVLSVCRHVPLVSGNAHEAVWARLRVLCLARRPADGSRFAGLQQERAGSGNAGGWGNNGDGNRGRHEELGNLERRRARTRSAHAP
jgi:hypothetical protein